MQQGFNNLIDKVQEYLSSRTTRKTKNTFYIRINNTWCRIDFQKSVSSDKEKVSFTINIGITVDAYNKYEEINETAPKKLIYPIGDRIGYFLPEKGDKWWTITLENDQAVTVEIIEIIDSTIIPYFEKYSQEDELILYLESKILTGKANISAFIILILLKIQNQISYKQNFEMLEKFALSNKLEHVFEEFLSKVSIR